MKLLIGIPSFGSPAKPFLESLAHLDLPAFIETVEHTTVVGNFVPAQRELLAERALLRNADILMMCDDDMVLPTSAITDLCSVLRDDPNVGLAGALYYSRDGLRPMVVDGWNGDDTSSGWIPAFDESTPVAVSGIGFGCVAIRTVIFKQLERPYFPAHVFIEHTDGRVRVCNEDYLFCEHLASLNMKTILHPNVRCGHYDRAHDRIMPFDWETSAATMQRRVLVGTGNSYSLIPVDAAPPATSHPQRAAAIRYIDSP